MAKILWHHFRFEAPALAVERKRTVLKERRCIVGGNSVAKKQVEKQSRSVSGRVCILWISLSLALSLSLSLSLCDSLSFSMLSLSLLSSRLLFFLGGFPAVGACGGVPAVDAWGGVSAVGP